MSGADEWHQILEPGEEIIWQGRPVPSRVISRPDKNLFGFGIGLVIIGIIWILAEMQENSPEQALKYLPFIAGCAIMAAAVIAAIYRPKRTWYSMSNRRTFIDTDIPLQKRSLKSYPLISETPLELIDEEPGTVLFSEELIDGGEGEDYWASVGFEHIPNPQHVYSLIQEIRSQAES